MTLVSGVMMLVLIAVYRWWMAIVLAAAWAFSRREAVRGNAAGRSAGGVFDAGVTTCALFREVVLRPDAAKEIRVFGLGSWLTGRFQALWQDIFVTLGEEKRKVRRSLIRRFAVLAVANALCLVVVMRDTANGGTSVRWLLLLVQAFLALTALATVQYNEVNVILGAESLARFEELEATLRPASRASRPAASRPTVEVRFTDVTYRYSAQREPALRHLNLVLPAGCSTALVGANGAGKTTLIKLMCGRSSRPTASSRWTVDRSETSTRSRGASSSRWCSRTSCTIRCRRDTTCSSETPACH